MVIVPSMEPPEKKSLRAYESNLTNLRHGLHHRYPVASKDSVFSRIARKTKGWIKHKIRHMALSSDDLARMQGDRTPDSAEPEAGPEDPFAGLPPPGTPLEAKRVWDEQRRPSSRSVAKALGAGLARTVLGPRLTVRLRQGAGLTSPRTSGRALSSRSALPRAGSSRGPTEKIGWSAQVGAT
jgi:hypothetical protein